jgi:hypothetical protein
MVPLLATHPYTFLDSVSILLSVWLKYAVKVAITCTLFALVTLSPLKVQKALHTTLLRSKSKVLIKKKTVYLAR